MICVRFRFKNTKHPGMTFIKTAALAALLSLLATRLEAQPKTWLTLEAGPQWSMLKVTDPDGYFQGANVRSYTAGFQVGQEILPSLIISTGLLYIPRNDGISMADDRPHQTRWTAASSFLIPVRAEYMIHPSDYPVYFTPRIGYVYTWNSSVEDPYAASSILSAPDGTVLSYDIQQQTGQTINHLLEVGIGVNLRFSNSWQTSLNLSYMTGLSGSATTRYLLDYSDGATTSASTGYTTKGNSLTTTLALNIPVSNIWQNKDYRIRKRIENSVYKGKPVERRGQVYLGGDVGSLWRAFSSNNPAVGPRPMEGGFFRFANLHTGLYGGYMLTDELGVDLGVYYQRSSTSYALMYDHETDFDIRMPAPLYLEIPVRFRYFHNLYKNKVHLVIYGGASLLTHFSRGIFEEGSQPFAYRPSTGAPEVNATTSYAASGTNRFAPVLRLGTGAEYRLPMEFPLIVTLYVNYMQGFLEMGRIEVTNSLAETPAASTISYTGSGISVDLGVKIPFRFGRGRCGQLPERE